MPVEGEGRMVEALPDKLNQWLGRVSHEPVQIATETPDLSAELKRGLAFVRERKKPRRKAYSLSEDACVYGSMSFIDDGWRPVL